MWKKLVWEKTTFPNCSQENRIAVKAKVKTGSISHAQLIDSLPAENAKATDLVAQDILKASSYLLHTHCRNTDIFNDDCVKFMSKYSLPESTKLSARCLEKKSRFKAYRRLLPASYKDGLQKVNERRWLQRQDQILSFISLDPNFSNFRQGAAAATFDIKLSIQLRLSKH